MTGVRVGLFCLGVMASASPVAAQAPPSAPRVTITAELLNVAIRGNDVHVGDVFTERQILSGTAASSRLDYGVNYDPIVTSMPTDLSAMVTVAYRGPLWQFGGRWWRATGEDDTSGSRSTAAPTPTSQFVTGIRLWENSLLPVTNQQTPSGISPVTFHADNRLEHWVLDGWAGLSWVNEPQLNLALRFGAAHADVENTRGEGQSQQAFVVTTTPTSTTTINNTITINSTAETTASYNGPMLALAGDTTIKRVRLEWVVGHSMMFGTAVTSGTWTDVDDIREVVTTTAGAQTQTLTLLNGTIPNEEDVRAIVPVLDLQFRGSVRITKAVSVGAGVFSSTWFGMPMAPAFVVPDDWTDLQGTAWRQQERDVTYAGFSIFGAFGF